MTMTDDKARLRAAARVWYDAGLCVMPAAADGTKRPHDAWKQYQSERPSWPVVQAWLNTGAYDGIGIICGAVSGNLEMFEIEGRAAADGMYDQLGMRMVEHGYADLWVTLCCGYQEQTPSGGFHWLYRVAGKARESLRLASRPSIDEELAISPEKTKVLMETRGEGGFTIVAPSGGRTHPDGTNWTWIKGSPAEIPTITEDERDALHAIAASFDTVPALAWEPREGGRVRMPGDPMRPGDDYNERATWAQILKGWTRCKTTNGGSLGWRRPGKTLGISATTGLNDGDNLYVFSSSTEFKTQTAYSKFAAYTLLEHGGDFKAAARHLGQNGYGEQRTAIAMPTPATTTERDEPPPAPSVTPAPPPLDTDALWGARPALEHLRTFARARMTSPWAVLGVALTRVVTLVPPHYVLPPIVGGVASLNLFIGLVGPSGGGKGAAENAAAGALALSDDVFTATVGSGEGIGHLYSHYEKGAVIRDRSSVLFTVPEVDNLVALSTRQGATLLPQLRSAWSGERLGFSYADKTKALPLASQTYRMCMVLGIQPGRAAPLLDDSEGGTPQRFLWLPTSDPGVPDRPPKEPLPFVVRSIVSGPVCGDVHGLVHLKVCDQAATTIIDNRRNQLLGNTEALNGHGLLARLKTAAALAILDNRCDVNDEDWRLAGLIMAVSDATRGGVVDYLRGTYTAANEARGRGEAERAVLVSETVQRAAVQRCARALSRHLQKAGEVGMVRNDLRRAMAQRDRGHFDEALDGLVEAGMVQVDEAHVAWSKGASA